MTDRLTTLCWHCRQPFDRCSQCELAPIKRRTARLMDELSAEQMERIQAEEAAYREASRLDAVLQHAHEIVCKIPGGLRVVESRDDIDAVIAAYEGRG